MNAKHHPEFDNYLIYDNGQVFSIKSGKFLKQAKIRGDYLAVCIVVEGKEYTRCIHRLVLETFVGPRHNGMQCCHLDGDKHNNRLHNLMWGSAQLNHDHKAIHGTVLKGQNSGVAKLTDADVVFIRKNYQRLSYHKSNAEELAARFDVSKSTITNIIRKSHWKHL